LNDHRKARTFLSYFPASLFSSIESHRPDRTALLPHVRKPRNRLAVRPALLPVLAEAAGQVRGTGTAAGVRDHPIATLARDRPPADDVAVLCLHPP
jgi:hypothetical protein